MALDATADRARALELAQGRLKMIDAKIAELTAAKVGLAHIAGECASSPEGPCPIIEAFDP